jgi:hypothetical protein
MWSDILEWFKELFTSFFFWVVEGLMSLAALLLALISLVPGVSEIVAGIAALPSEVLWVMSFFEVPTGMALVASAYSARFMLRRIFVLN